MLFSAKLFSSDNLMSVLTLDNKSFSIMLAQKIRIDASKFRCMFMAKTSYRGQALFDDCELLNRSFCTRLATYVE